MVLRIVSLITWLLSVASILIYIPMSITAYANSESSRNIKEVNIYLVVALSIVAAIELLIGFAIRYFALTRPAKRGTFTLSSIGRKIRFFLVHFFNWSIGESIAIYGMVLYLLYGKLAFLLVFSAVGLGTVLLHAPRLKPFQPNEETQDLPPQKDYDHTTL